MKRRIDGRRSTAIVTFILLSFAATGAASPAGAALPVDAQIYSTMPSTEKHRPQMALDGDVSTYFESAGGMGDGDDFFVLLSRPIPVTRLTVTSGDTSGGNLLTN